MVIILGAMETEINISGDGTSETWILEGSGDGDVLKVSKCGHETTPLLWSERWHTQERNSSILYEIAIHFGGIEDASDHCPSTKWIKFL